MSSVEGGVPPASDPSEQSTAASAPGGNSGRREFCTYFDSNYLSRGVALYRSLARHAEPFKLTVLSLDLATERTIARLRLPGLEALPIAELEQAHPELLAAKANRSKVEYYFTCTSSLLLHLLERGNGAGTVSYLDADLYFFSSVEPVYRELGDGSILIVGHRFPEHLRSLEEHGVFNVGLLAFTRDANALECVRWWRDRCIEWCYDRVEDGRFADQKYLDDWPTRFRGVRVLEHRGSGVAPWNVETHAVSELQGRVHVGAEPLCFYHFHGLKKLNPWVYDSGLGAYRANMTPALRRHVYQPYLRELRDVERWLDEAAPDPERRWGSVRRFRRPYVSLAKGLLRGSLLIAGGRAAS